MKIRYYEKKYEGGSIPVAHTANFNEDGKPTSSFEIAIVNNDGKFLTKWAMLKELKNPVWPDRWMGSFWPTLPALPPKYIKVFENTDDGGTILVTIENPEHFVVKAEYDAIIEEFKNKFKIQYPEWNLCVIQKFWYPTIPGGEDWVWELVDDSKPYFNGRYTKIESVEGLYNGPVWRVVDDFNAPKIQGLVSTLYLTTPLQGLKIISNVK